MGIYVFYDKEGILDDYVIYMLSELRKVINYLIVVVNGNVNKAGEQVLKENSDRVIIRENYGFDGGAYRDVFMYYIPQEELKKFDEVVLLNDSLYGPFYPFSELWQKAENLETDFWGISRYPGCEYPDGSVFSKHIESFFLVIRKRMLMSRAFMKFWKDVIRLSNNLMDVIAGFEDAFTVFFEENGFKSGALTDIYEAMPTLQPGEVPYFVYPYELVRNGVCPFLKRKCLWMQLAHYKNGLKAYDYVKQFLNYDVALIDRHLLRLNREGNYCREWDLAELEKFYNGHKRVFVFGNGNYWRIIQQYVEYRGWEISGKFVSNKSEVKDTEQVYYDGALTDGDGLIVALGKKNMDSVLPLLKDKLGMGQLLFPRYN
jgi:rhamnosyltransferase